MKSRFLQTMGRLEIQPSDEEYGLAKAKSMEEEVGDANSHGGALLDERLWREMPEKMAEVLRSS